MAFWFLVAAISVALSVASFFLRPRPPKAKPNEFSELESPTSGAGQPVRKVYGRVKVKPHVLWFGDKNRYAHKIKA